jgi:hypothetical protein
LEGSVVGVGDVAGDGQAEAAAGGVAGASVGQAGEALEDAFAVVECDAGAVVGDGDDGVAVGGGGGDLDGVFGVAACVVQEVVDHPDQLDA